MTEINLLKKYPKTKRKINERVVAKTPLIRLIARKFGKEFFDGDRKYGYGGFSYRPKYWQGVVKDFRNYYHLTKNSSVLDVGCAKGFMLYDLMRLIPGINICGIDISSYAVKHAKEEVRPYLKVADAKSLPFGDKSFDLVISINTIHNLALSDCMKALKEISRVSKTHAFVTVDAYRNNREKKRMEAWNLTALTYMSTKDWEELFTKVGFTGDYYWFIP